MDTRIVLRRNTDIAAHVQAGCHTIGRIAVFDEGFGRAADHIAGDNRADTHPGSAIQPGSRCLSHIADGGVQLHRRESRHRQIAGTGNGGGRILDVGQCIEGLFRADLRSDERVNRSKKEIARIPAQGVEGQRDTQRCGDVINAV